MTRFGSSDCITSRLKLVEACGESELALACASWLTVSIAVFPRAAFLGGTISLWMIGLLELDLGRSFSCWEAASSGIVVLGFDFDGLTEGLLIFFGGNLVLIGLKGAEDREPIAIDVAGRGKIGRVGETDDCADSGRSASFASFFFAAIVSFNEGPLGTDVVLRLRPGALGPAIAGESTGIRLGSGLGETLSNRPCCLISSDCMSLLLS